MIAEGRTRSHVNEAILAEGDARSARAAGLADKQLLHMHQRVPVELTAQQGDAALPPERRFRIRLRRLAGLVEGEIDELVLRKLGMHNHIVQPAVPIGRIERWDSPDRFRIERSGRARGARDVVDQSQRAATFRNQRVTGRQQSDCERVLQALRHHHRADLVLLGRIERIRALRKHHRGNSDVRRLLRQNRTRR